ncbi:MAG: tRNA (guanosine(37)-N1)-methyltransferase TrmD, partial [Deltaproteobacteria bacterium]|nr:tRNA (guanosine(37)-N1)-methyltransferase TrmD [Deltaproteobacteria bacterium]
MLIEVLTLFPEFFASPLSQSMLSRAQSQGAVEFRILNLRDFTTDRHRVVDDRPFGGGPGMVLKIEPLVRAIRAVREQDPEVRVILLSPRGLLFSQDKARELA